MALLKEAKGLIPAYKEATVKYTLGSSLVSPFSLLTPPPPPPSGKVKERVWISLTTLPGRIHQIGRIMESLLTQTVAADEIVISVPEHSDREAMEYPIPDWLEEMTRRKKLPRVRANTL